MIVAVLEKYLKKTQFDLNREKREQGIAYLMEDTEGVDLDDPEVWAAMYEDPYDEDEEEDPSKNDEGGLQD